MDGGGKEVGLKIVLFGAPRGNKLLRLSEVKLPTLTQCWGHNGLDLCDVNYFGVLKRPRLQNVR